MTAESNFKSIVARLKESTKKAEYALYCYKSNSLLRVIGKHWTHLSDAEKIFFVRYLTPSEIAALVSDIGEDLVLSQMVYIREEIEKKLLECGLTIEPSPEARGIGTAKAKLAQIEDRSVRVLKSKGGMTKLSGVDLNASLQMALERYAKYLTDARDIEVQRFDDIFFPSSAVQKANNVFECLPPNLRNSKTLFVSVGGFDGTELLHLLERSGAKRGILMEMLDSASAKAQASAQARGLEIIPFVGDLMQKLDDAIQMSVDLLAKREFSAIVVTAHAILHELFERSVGMFTLRDFFSRLPRCNYVIGREPIEPTNSWSGDVILSGDFDATVFRKLAELILDKNPVLREKSRVLKVVNRNTIEIGRALAIETLAKAFYSKNLMYEIGECVTRIAPEELQQEMSLCLDETHTITYNLHTSNSWNQIWEDFHLRAYRPDQTYLPKPYTHISYIAALR